ncbi:protein kinase [Luteolibacter sp. Populi]|uniref:protein kinase domain-containing protein n=1 Tax=Luteolibacter sp. Populi TaxID=3230487 RepID=UPI0034667026
MSASPACPRCGSPLDPSGAAGLCPRCLLAMNLRTRTMPTGEHPSSSPPPSPAELEEKFPQFEILECLGRGGMGVVYKARQKALDRIVAIKILAGEWQDDPGFASRFEKEAKLLARLNHPNIVTIHDFGHAGGLFHIVMEYIDGVNVRDLLRDGRLEPEQALAIVPPICDALQFAHDHGVVHRDIKPENILLDREGRVKIADFGIATIAGEAADRSGTPDYMAPEQATHSAGLDHRADIYSLGVVLYEMLTGQRPGKRLEVPSNRVHIDVKIDEIVLRALQGRPELRFQTAGEFKTVVETFAATPPAPATQQPSPGKAARSGAPSEDAPPPPPVSPAQEPTIPESRSRLALITLLVALFGTPLLISFVNPSREGIVLLLGLCCALASIVLAVLARRTRKGKTVLAIWCSLIAILAMLGIVYAGLNRSAVAAARERAQVEARNSEHRELAEKMEQSGKVVFTPAGIDPTLAKPDPSAYPGLFTETDPGRLGKAIAKNRLRIAFDDKGALSLNGNSTDLPQLAATLRKFAARDSERPVKILSTTPQIDLERLSGILDACRGAGFTRLTFWNASDHAEVSKSPPLLITLSLTPDTVRSFTLDGSALAWKDMGPALGKFAAADLLRQVRIHAITQAGQDSEAALLLSICRQYGFVRLFYTSDPDEFLPATPTVITIAKDGNLLLDGLAMPFDRLLETLHRLTASDPQRPVKIVADAETPYTAIQAVLDLCSRAAITNISFGTSGKSTLWEEMEAALEADRIAEADRLAQQEPPLPKWELDPTLTQLLPKPAIQIHLTMDGGLTLDGKAISLEALRFELVAISRVDPQRQVRVSGDKDIPAGRIQEIMNVCGEASLPRVSVLRSLDRLQEVEFNSAFKSYEILQTRLRDARLDRALLSGSGEAGEQDQIKAERLISLLEKSLEDERANIEQLQRQEDADLQPQR